MQETLSHYFGYETFRPGQKEIITKILDHRNTLGVLPTGGGKSICYQVPGLMLGGTTIVISPLISLIYNHAIYPISIKIHILIYVLL